MGSEQDTEEGRWLRRRTMTTTMTTARTRTRWRRRETSGDRTEKKEDGHNGGHMPAGASRRRRVRRSKRREGERLRASVQRERKIMRCFCIIRYTDSLPAWRTGIRPKRSAGCNEKSPSVARGSTYFRVRPASPLLSLFSSLSLLPLFLSPSVFLSLSRSAASPPPCSSSPSG